MNMKTSAQVFPEGRVLMLISEFQQPENSFATQAMTIWIENGT